MHSDAISRDPARQLLVDHGGVPSIELHLRIAHDGRKPVRLFFQEGAEGRGRIADQVCHSIDVEDRDVRLEPVYRFANRAGQSVRVTSGAHDKICAERVVLSKRVIKYRPDRIVQAADRKMPFDALVIGTEQSDASVVGIIKDVRARQAFRGLPIILLTTLGAGSSLGQLERVTQLHKPIRFSELYNSLATSLSVRLREAAVLQHRIGGGK